MPQPTCTTILSQYFTLLTYPCRCPHMKMDKRGCESSDTAWEKEKKSGYLVHFDYRHTRLNKGEWRLKTTGHQKRENWNTEYWLYIYFFPPSLKPVFHLRDLEWGDEFARRDRRCWRVFMGVNERHWKAQWSSDANCFYSHSSSLPVPDFNTTNDLILFHFLPLPLFPFPHLLHQFIFPSLMFFLFPYWIFHFPTLPWTNRVPLTSPMAHP